MDVVLNNVELNVVELDVVRLNVVGVAEVAEIVVVSRTDVLVLVLVLDGDFVQLVVPVEDVVRINVDVVRMSHSPQLLEVAEKI